MRFADDVGMTWRMVGGDIRFRCPFLAFAGDLMGELLRFMVAIISFIMTSSSLAFLTFSLLKQFWFVE